MLEEEILAGRAIAVLQAPQQCSASQASLTALFHTHLTGTAAADVERCVISKQLEESDGAKVLPTTSTAENGHAMTDANPTADVDVDVHADGDVVVAAVKFFSPEGVEAVLDRLQVISSRNLGVAVVRRGYLALGPVKLLVEGLARPSEDSADGGSEDPTQCPVSTTVAGPTVAVEPSEQRRPVPAAAEKEEVTAAPASTAALTPVSFSLRVALFDLKLLFSRRDSHASETAPRKEFPLSPFMIVQLLRSVNLCPVALRLGSRFFIHNNQTPVFRFLVEFATDAAMNRAIQEMDDVVVDLKSPSSGGASSTEAALQAYVRRPQLEKFPDWLEHIDNDRSKGLTGRLRRMPFDPNFLLLGESAEERADAEKRLGKCFDHAWVSPLENGYSQQQHAQARATSSASAASYGQLRRSSGVGDCDNGVSRNHGGAKHSETNSNASGLARQRMKTEETYQQQQERHQRFLQPPTHRHTETSGGNQHRSRSSSDERRQRKTSRTDTAVTPQTTAVTATAAAVVQAQTQAQAQAAYLSQQQALYPSAIPLLMSHNPYLQFLQQQQQMAAALQAQQLLQSAMIPAASPPLAAAAATGAQDSLPAGWSAVFSEQYKQTYYVFHDPVTGQDTTTWTRPG